ncbi:hypothetical protein JHK87_041127 [Glycine soja]|nr:hypothetical protein JHK87_041127 [Glycine soja]
MAETRGGKCISLGRDSLKDSLSRKRNGNDPSNNEKCCSTQLIDGDGAFNVAGIENFMKEVKLSECGLSYAVVSIMGPQSSGKSTLLNSLFCTNFTEMDAFKGRHVSTTPIHSLQQSNLAITINKDDTTFEKQSALFALAISDIVLINMWCHDIGREQAANKPLLKTVFQVMMRLFSPRKTTMLFVIRDKTKIWDSVPKPDAHKETPLSEFFIVEVVALSSFEEKEEQFKEQVANLRQRFYHSIAPGGLAGDRRGVVPASGFSFSAQEIWKIIKENKDLDLPAHKVMVATVRCEEIANEKYDLFATNKDWCELEEAVQSGPISEFGKKLNSLLIACLSEYDAEANYFDEGVRSAKQKQLQEKLFQLVQPTFQIVLGHMRSGILDKFKEAFDKALNGGEGFSSAANKCIEIYMAQFDEGCAGVIFVGYLLIKALWAQLDITGEFRNGALPGIISLSSKFVPTIMNLIRKLAEEGQGHANNDPRRSPSKNNQSAIPAGRVTSSSASSSVTSPGNGTEYTSSSKHE